MIGDDRRLKQVLINLIKNAIKFTHNGMIEVIVSYSTQHKQLQVQVADTGVGISEADIPKLFNQFGKLHRTASMNSEGIGLGLSIVK